MQQCDWNNLRRANPQRLSRHKILARHLQESPRQQHRGGAHDLVPKEVDGHQQRCGETVTPSFNQGPLPQAVITRNIRFASGSPCRWRAISSKDPVAQLVSQRVPPPWQGILGPDDYLATCATQIKKIAGTVQILGADCKIGPHLKNGTQTHWRCRLLGEAQQQVGDYAGLGRICVAPGAQHVVPPRISSR